MAVRILRPTTAFSNAPVGKQKKRQRENAPDHLAWIRTLPCCITGRLPVDPAHIRYADPVYGKRETGKGEKPDDKWTVPLVRAKHDEQHSMDERIFWARHGLDPLRIALSLYACTGDDDQAFVILREAWAVARTFPIPENSHDA
jgi:hypothetical protein